MDVVPRAEWVRHGNVGYIHTYIHKEYLYRAYYPNSESLYALRSLNKLKSAQRDTNLRAGTLQPDRTF